MNNTRKVHYPMMLEKYNQKKISPWNLHDFREAMLLIVKKDNDDIFSEYLNKKSGRAQVKTTQSESMRKFVDTVHISPEEGVQDRTTP